MPDCGSCAELTDAAPGLPNGGWRVPIPMAMVNQPRARRLLLILGVACLGSCSPGHEDCCSEDGESKLLGTFVETTGEHFFVCGERSFRVLPEADGLHWEIVRYDVEVPSAGLLQEPIDVPWFASVERSSWSAVTTPGIVFDPEDPWFAFFESRDRLWISDGKGTLLFYESTLDADTLYSSEVGGDWFDNQVPPQVTARMQPTEGNDDGG